MIIKTQNTMDNKFSFKELRNVVVGYGIFFPSFPHYDVIYCSRVNYHRSYKKGTPKEVTFEDLTKLIKTRTFNELNSLRIEKEVLERYQTLMLMVDSKYIEKIAKRLSKAIYGDESERLIKKGIDDYVAKPTYLAYYYHNTKRYYDAKRGIGQ